MDTKSVEEFSAWINKNALPGQHKRGSENTIKGYVSDLSAFAGWFEESTGMPLSAENLTPDDIQDHISYLQSVLKRKPATVLRRFAAIRAYCLYLLQTDDRITSDLTTGIRLPKREPASKTGLRRKERNAVGRVFSVPWKNTEQGRNRLVRDKAIVFTLMYVGLRVEELEKLRVDDLTVSKRDGYIRVLEGKGNRSRTVGIPSKARDPLREWAKLRDTMDLQHDALFCQIGRGKNPLKKRMIQYIVEETGRRAGIKLSAHLLRHTAVRVWRKEADDRTAAAQMGHSIATMQRYDAITTEDVLEAAKSF